MKIILGLDSGDTSEIIDSYIKDGADEFFLGFVPCEWYNYYGWEISPNRRTYGHSSQFTEYESLEKTISLVHQRNKKIFIVFNAHQYNFKQSTLLKQIICKIEEFNPDGYIVADPALMILLRELGIKRALHLSTGAACYNSAAIKYYSKRLGIDRVVLPRKMSLKEIDGLTKKCGSLKIEFEAMVIYYRCYFNDEHCFTWHSGKEQNFCSYFVETEKQINKLFPEDWKETFNKILQTPLAQFEEGSLLDEFIKENHSKFVPNFKGEKFLQSIYRPEKAKGISSRLTELFFINCGLCAISELKKSGVTVLKIPVRGEPLKKRKFLRIVKKVLNNRNPTREFCRSLINSPDFCLKPGKCYYNMGD